ncbi:DUF2470 domain-containing protein [uncultured Sneathiella sp.]|uniref:HugZ family pyridoxamine 5'-phosphate oxidase n=1 Tax=uncultured Sneathiella sp. TaxID=879315 RepID=UPI0030D7709E
MQTRALTIRGLLRGATTASLATNMAEDANPYASLVLVATDPVGRPLMLLSDMAVHSRNIVKNSNVSLLIAEEPNGRDPLTLSRVSIEGTLGIIEDAKITERYLRRFPSARGFVGFKDFNLYRMEVRRGHLVAGFGDIHWVDESDFLLPPGFLDDIDVEMDVVDHMNTDHLDAVQELCNTHGNDTEDFEITGIDREGIDFRCGWTYQRILFDEPVSSPDSIRTKIIEMLKNVRN